MSKFNPALTTVTSFSKFLAIIIFFLFIVSAFLIGMKYQTKIDGRNNLTACPQIAKLCPDGSYVSRTGPNCEFTPCP